MKKMVVDLSLTFRQSHTMGNEGYPVYATAKSAITT